MIADIDEDASDIALKVIDLIYSQIIKYVKNKKTKRNFELLKENRDYKFFDDINPLCSDLMPGFIKIIPFIDYEWYKENFKIIGYRNDSEIVRATFGYKSIVNLIKPLSDSLAEFVYDNEWENPDTDRVFIRFMCGIFFLWFLLYKAFGFTFYDSRFDKHIVIVETERYNLTEEDVDVITYHELGHVYYGDNTDEEIVSDIKEERANHFAITCCKHFGFGKTEPNIDIDLKPIMAILNLHIC